jgi:hypothetical protein
MRLHLSSVKDASGKELIGHLLPATAAHLYVGLTNYALKDHTDATIASMQDRDGNKIDAAAPTADEQHGIHLTTPLTISGFQFHAGALDGNPDHTEHVEGITDFTVPQGLSTAKDGDVITATGTGVFDGGGASISKGPVTLAFTVDAGAPVAAEALGFPFANNESVTWEPDPVRLTEPGTLDAAVQMSVDGGKRFDMKSLNGINLLDTAWFFDATGAQWSQPSDDAKKRTVFFPTGTNWDGQPRPAVSIDLTPLPLTALDKVNFSDATTAAAPYLALRGNAKVAQDANCDGAASCLVIEEPPRDDTKACSPSMAAYRVGLTKKGTHYVRMRVLGQDAADGDRVNVNGYGGDLVLDPLKPSTAVAGFGYDSGWITILEPYGGIQVATIHACAPGVRLMVQSDVTN